MPTRLTCCCLLAALTFVSLPAASNQLELPDINSFLKFWDSEKKVEPDMAAQDYAEGKARSRSRRASGDSSMLENKVETSSLPTFANGSVNHRYMPVLGNGLISTSAYSKYIHVNGLYAGTGGNTHRASVPAVIVTRVTLHKELEGLSQRTFSFDAYEGVFIEKIDCPFAYIIHRTYIHQKYIRLLVTDIKVTRKDREGGTFYLEYPDFETNEDIRFEEPRLYQGVHWKVTGRTLEAEAESSVASVHSFFHERQKSISVTSGPDERHEVMVQSVDIMENDAQTDFDKAREILQTTDGIERLFAEHKQAWADTWAKGKIQIEGDAQIAKTTIFAQYYILATMPPMFPQKAPGYKSVYTGISRTSLARGANNKDYRGHIFWDNEMYLMPALLLFHPQLAKEILHIRSAGSNAARAYAQQNGRQGLQFPWEVALTGYDVTPDSCPDCRNNALHVTGAVGWSIRQYFSATRDQGYMTDPEYNGCEMTKEIARFWANLAVYNNSIGRYDINNVTGPDDWHPRINNNAYTNVMASLSIHWARYFACMCGRNERDEVPDEWMAVADFVELPFDNEKRVHHQFQVPMSNRSIKQADTILLTYPLNWNMSRDIMRNDLDMYETAIQGRTPAMTYSFMAVGYKWGEEPSKVDSYFRKSFEDYTIQPFKIWTEYIENNEADQEASSVNYLPAMGAYLQSLIYGYGGIRVRPEFLEFHWPTPPPGCNRMLFSSFDYLGTEMTIDIWTDRVSITIIEVGDYPLILKRNATTMIDEKLTVGASVTIDNPKEGFYILTTEGTACDHPRDYIYMPWGYSPWISSADHLRSGLLLPLMFILTLLLLLSEKK